MSSNALPSRLLSALVGRQQASLNAAQQALLRMRFSGYVGVQWVSLLIPVLLYQLTGSLALMGMIVMIEWAPKVFTYILGGSIVSRWGGSAAHQSLEGLRMLALVVLLACTLGHGGIATIVVASVTCQCANAISNVLFERGVSRNWEPPSRALGHMLHMRQDQMGCLIALLISIALDSATAVACLALISQGITVVQALRHAPKVHPCYKSTDSSNETLDLAGQVKTDMKAVCKRPLITAWVYYVASSVPFAAVNSFVVFMLGANQPAAAVGIATMASVLLSRVVASLLVMQWALPRLAKTGSEREMAKWSFVGATGFFTLLAVPGPIWLSAAGITGVAICNLLRLPYLRTTRQALITHHVSDKNSWPGATGLFASGEALPYLIAGGMAALLQGHLIWLMASSVAVGAWGMWRFLRYDKIALPHQGANC